MRGLLPVAVVVVGVVMQAGVARRGGRWRGREAAEARWLLLQRGGRGGGGDGADGAVAVPILAVRAHVALRVGPRPCTTLHGVDGSQRGIDGGVDVTQDLVGGGLLVLHHVDEARGLRGVDHVGGRGGGQGEGGGGRVAVLVVLLVQHHLHGLAQFTLGSLNAFEVAEGGAVSHVLAEV